MAALGHSSKRYDSDLDAIRARVLSMGRLVETQFKEAVACLHSGDLEQAKQIIEADDIVDDQERVLDQCCCDLILSYQQADAKDLRGATATIHVVSDLERIGDEASRIAHAVKNLAKSGAAGELISFDTVRVVSDRTGQLLHDALSAFSVLDARTASCLAKNDDVVDHELRSIMRNAIMLMLEDGRTISAALEMLSLTKAIERIGEHVKNIAKWVLYVAEEKSVSDGQLA